MDYEIYDLGLIDFEKAWQFQKDIFLKVKAGIYPSALIFCRHYPVITLGRLARRDNILATGDELKIRGIKVLEIERGGEVTYHGPGQLTVYPIFNFRYLKKDICWFLRQLERVIILSLADFGAKAGQRCGLTGVWVEESKIASIGIAVKSWVSFHGLSINIKEGDLDNFRLIRPCGMDIKMVSLENAAGRTIQIDEVKDALLDKFKQIGGLDDKSSFASLGRRN
ncbi:MAG: lipoyl(octanoyl) transferase LipB [Candidatus Omnitrophica bacterium]|nr:lipoyl(octanoyl) transferase LipB [Candidatus Omnitrophota bacterium]